MRVAYLIRESYGVQGGLQGTDTIYEGLQRCLQAIGIELVYVPVPGTVWDDSASSPPELYDLLATPALAEAASNFDFVLNNEFGFLPYLRLAGISHSHLTHMNVDAVAEDEIGWVLKKMVAFADHVIAPYPEVVTSWSGNYTVLPYPVYLPESVLPVRDLDFVWAGRDEPLKGTKMLAELLAGPLGEMKGQIFFSYSVGEISYQTETVSVEIGRPRQAVLHALSRARFVISTSITEVFATVLVEGVMLGAIPLVFSDLHLPHLKNAWNPEQARHLFSADSPEVQRQWRVFMETRKCVG